MKSQTHLTLRGTTYWFRCRVPADLVAEYGKKEISFSLKTKDKKDAVAKAKVESLKLTQEFDHKRSFRQADSIRDLSQVEIDRLIALWGSSILADDEERRIFFEQDTFGGSYEHGIDIGFDLFDEAFRKSDTNVTTKTANSLLQAHHIKLNTSSESYKRLCYGLLKEGVRVYEMLGRRQRGEIIEAPTVEPVVIRSDIPDPKQDTLDYLSNYWQTKGKRGRSATAEATTIIKKFKALVQDIPPSRIEKRHIVQLEDKMLEAGAAPATINKGIGILGAILQCAHENGKVGSNPCHGRKKLRVPEPEEEKPYTPEELTAIFHSPIFTQGYRPKAGLGEAAFWMPLIGLYTGARVAEVGQLYVEDVKEEQGIWHFHIKNDVETDRRVKNSGSVRRVPLHPDLIAMGLLDYLTKTKEAGHKQLFPLLKVTRKGGKLTDKWRSWWSEYVRGLGITRIPKPFHSFRDTFKDACRVCEVTYEVHQRLTGHSSGNEGDKYGGKLFPLKPLNEGVRKVVFQGLDLSHLKKIKIP